MQLNDLERFAFPQQLVGVVVVVVVSKVSSARRKFAKNVESLVSKLFAHAPLDAACDQMAKDLLQNSLPPQLSKGFAKVIGFLKETE